MKNILILLALTISTVALANHHKPYGMAGCGWGSQMHDKDGNQIMAATTNGTGTQTFGISSGSSNCVTATEHTAKIKNFIEANYESLVTDMARGNGDSINTLSAMYGCNNDNFATTVKNNYAKITPKAQDATFVMVNINNVIEDTPALYNSCKNVL
jgi:hypothetical protein